MNIEWFIFKQRSRIRMSKLYSRVTAKYKIFVFQIVFWYKYRNYDNERQIEILQRYARFFYYKKDKKGSIDRYIASKIPGISEKTGLQQHEVRYILDRIFER